MTNWIQFIKTVEGKEVINVNEKSKVIISSCFNFCDASVQERVAVFLLSNEDEITLEIDDDDQETVVLRREREKDESKK